VITVRELMEVGGFDEGAVLAGAHFLDKELLGVTSFDSPDGYKWLRPGEFILTTGFPFVAQKETVETGLIRLMDALVEVGTPGLAIKLGRYIEALPDRVLAHAEEKQLPVLAFPMELAWSDVIVPVIRYINDKQRSELDRTHAIYERFHQHLTAGKHVSCLADLLHDVLQVPVSIHVPTLRWEWDSPIQATEERGMDKQIGQQAPQSMIQQPITKNPNGDYIRWLLQGNIVKGAIFLRQLNRDLHVWEKVAIEQSAALLSLEMERQRTVNETFQRFRNDFLQLLVNSQPGTKDVWTRKAEEVGWELAEDYVAVVVSVHSQTEANMKAWKENVTLLETIRGILDTFDLPVLFGLDRANRILLLVPVTEEETAPVERLLSSLARTLTRQRHQPVYLGVGRFHPGWEGIARSYREAQVSLRTAAHSNWLSHEAPLRKKDFRELGLERILFAELPGEEAHAVAEECLGKISRYDQEKNGQLLQTLEAFLHANGNHAEAASRLFVHKNTIKYRLQLIRELTGLHPENGQDQLLYRVALTVHAIGRQT
jgi:purine catabolism regulator